jgi:hypothetical protein
MKKAKTNQKASDDRDTMRPEYDFTGAMRGVTAKRYAQGTNIVAVDPDVRDVFPDSGAVNEALRALAPLLREQHGGRGSRTKRSSRPRPKTRSAKRLRSSSGRSG